MRSKYGTYYYLLSKLVLTYRAPTCLRTPFLTQVKHAVYMGRTYNIPENSNVSALLSDKFGRRSGFAEDYLYRTYP